ncbi:hypothetical protein CK203_047144 [Vitis vinifera]|uniref:Uncharacterized protein n=1 Tax=Vitis vinifera TaxID=29760 RepID=A0A438GST6_VITVI|nr:hypothetical protein CK203_047144 [Vitis vinifera]
MASSMAFADCSTSAPTRTFLFSRLRPRRGLPSIPPHLLQGLPVAGFRLPSLRIKNSPSSFPKGNAFLRNKQGFRHFRPFTVLASVSASEGCSFYWFVVLVIVGWCCYLLWHFVECMANMFRSD